MDTQKSSRSQPLSLEILENIDGQLCNEEITIRLIHHWEARNPKKGNILMGIELLLLDCKSNVAQAFVSVNRLFRYSDNLKTNTVYKIKNFILKPPKKFFKVCDSKYTILFTEKTMMECLPQDNHSIAKQKFRLHTLPTFCSLADTNTHLFDVIGTIDHIKGDNLESPTAIDGTSPQATTRARTEERVLIHLLQKDGETIYINLWGKIAGKFRNRWNETGVKPEVLLITAVNPKTFQTVLTLNSTSATRLFYDTDVNETTELLESIRKSVTSVPTVTTSSSAITKLETVTFKELNHFVQNETPQAATFNCVATIVDIQPQNSWYYISCSSCNTKLEKTETSLYCNSCKKSNNIGLIRYRLEITVRDKDEDIATFVVFDREGTNFVGKRGVDILSEITEDGDETHQHQMEPKIPDCIKVIIGQTCKFQVKVMTYNFQASRQTFSVSRVLSDSTGVQPEQFEQYSTTKDADVVILPMVRKNKAKDDLPSTVNDCPEMNKHPWLNK